jgi:hypothetical protein
MLLYDPPRARLLLREAGCASQRPSFHLHHVSGLDKALQVLYCLGQGIIHIMRGAQYAIGPTGGLYLPHLEYADFIFFCPMVSASHSASRSQGMKQQQHNCFHCLRIDVVTLRLCRRLCWTSCSPLKSLASCWRLGSPSWRSLLRPIHMRQRRRINGCCLVSASASLGCCSNECKPACDKGWRSSRAQPLGHFIQPW